VIATVAIPAVTLAAMVLVATAICCVLVARRPAPPVTASRSTHAWHARRAGHRSPSAGPVVTPRLWLGVATGCTVLGITRWPVLAVVAGVLVAGWHRLLHDDHAAEERRRVEGIAKWLEDLRDTLRGSSVGTEEALEQVAARAPEAVREPLAVFVLRRRQGVRTEDALTDLAEALAHPTSDAAIAAIRLVVTGTAGAGRLYPTVNALAAAARDEVRARERVDRTRTVYRSSMTRLVVIAAGLIAYLRIAAAELLAPYGTPLGQVLLLLPLAMWGGCIIWLRSLCRYEAPARYRIAGSAP